MVAACRQSPCSLKARQGTCVSPGVAPVPPSRGWCRQLCPVPRCAVRSASPRSAGAGASGAGPARRRRGADGERRGSPAHRCPARPRRSRLLPAPPRRAGNAPFGRRFPPGARRAGPEAEARAAGPGRVARWRRRGRAARRAPWPPAPASTSRTPRSTCGTSSSWTGREVRSGERRGPEAAGPGRAGPCLGPRRGSPSAVVPPPRGLSAFALGVRPGPLHLRAPGSALRAARGQGVPLGTAALPAEPGPGGAAGEEGRRAAPGWGPALRDGVGCAGQSRAGRARGSLLRRSRGSIQLGGAAAGS